MRTLADLTLVRASVDADATFEEAARILSQNRLASIAVLEEGKVVGLFTDEELLLGIFPRYLDELRHTAFLEAELPSLRERAAEVRHERVRAHMRKPVTVQAEATAFHAAERFVHTDEAAVAVVDDEGRFRGMLERTEFAHALLRRLTAPDAQSS
ncbi:MAG TPA: CBS domain-containing protein [Gaiellaceae bacterium]|nr:CBS domain-containing protein [Gaiellaceae bacterium]